MLEKILRDLENKGYCHLEKFLDEDALNKMNQFIDEHKCEFEAAKVGPRDQKQRVESVRGDFTYWLDPLASESPFAPLFKTLDELKESVNAHFYLGLQQYECHLAYYPPGTFYNKHLDRFERESSRKLTFIFYLNKDWSPESGGELVMYDKAGEVVDRIYPMPGTFITFISDEFPHEVRPSSKERRSFTGWMHTKIIY